jgi:hypothetical protein
MANGSEKTTKSKDENRTNLLYKNLEFISNAYYSAEGIFPFWESAYALIVGQLLVAYFQREQSYNPVLIIFSGLVFSFLWYRLVTLNRQHAKYLDHTMKHLEFKLIQEYRKCGLEFYTESFPESLPGGFSSYGNKIKYFKYEFGCFAELWPKKEALKSTWYFRRMLPLILFFLWLFLLVILLLNIQLSQIGFMKLETIFFYLYKIKILI